MPNSWIHFNDGEGLTHEDLEDVTLGLLAHLDDQLYGTLVAAATVAPDDYPASYGAGSRQVVADGHALAISYGGGTRTVSFQPGRVYVIDETDGDPTVQPWGSRAVKSAEVPGQSFNLSANASGSDRWDIVVVDTANFLAVAGSTESRDFKDAVTGALSTTTPNKRITLPTLLEVVEGTPGAGQPATPSGHVKVAAFKVPNGAATVGAGTLVYTDVIDYVSRGKRRHVGIPGRMVESDDASWVASGHEAQSSSAVNPVAYWYPGDFAGDPEAKLRGIVIEHAADEAFTAELVRRSHDGTADVVLQTITVGTTDGQHRYIEANASAAVPVAGSPIWCNGTSYGRARDTVSSWAFGWSDSSLALKITAGPGTGTDTTIIRHVHWIIAH